MQEQVNEKIVALSIRGAKLTAVMLQKAMKKLLEEMKRQQGKPPKGKQTLKQLMKQNAGVSNIEITGENIKAFESTAKKYYGEYYITSTGNKYHDKDCGYVKGKDNIERLTVEQYESGEYEPCGKCLPSEE